MMNQNYGFTGRSGRSGYDRGLDRGYDRAPYRRSLGRSGMPDRGMYAYGAPTSPRTNGGCGCGMNRSTPQPFGHGKGESVLYGQNRVIPATNTGECGCGNNRSGNCNGNHNESCNDNAVCHRLMNQIRAVDFALYETVLYLNVYPNSCDALETYHKLKAQSKALREEYESSCGPLTAFGNQSTTSWDWMSKPAPWEYEAD